MILTNRHLIRANCTWGKMLSTRGNCSQRTYLWLKNQGIQKRQEECKASEVGKTLSARSLYRLPKMDETRIWPELVK
jgi:hypothetical protein